MKYLKYVLAVATLLIVCATFALADGSAPVATVNGVPYSSLSDAVSSASSGDVVRVVSSTSFDTFSIPSGVLFVVPAGVELHTSTGYISVAGSASISGDIYRDGSVSSSDVLLRFTSGSNSTIYGDLISSSSSGLAVNVSGSANLVIYGGSFFGFDQAIYQGPAATGSVTIFGGNFSSVNYPPLSSNLITPFGRRPVTVEVGVRHQVVSLGGLYEVGRIVLSAVNWVSLMCAAIVTNKLLLLFFVFVFCGVGLGLIKRIVS